MKLLRYCIFLLALPAFGQNSYYSSALWIPSPPSVFSLPAGRAPTWQGNVGVEGGIPNVSTIYTNLTPSGGDDASAIASAFNSAASNTVVQLGTGTFLINTTAQLTNSYAVLRGEGPSNTTLVVTNSGSTDCGIWFDNGSGINWAAITQGYGTVTPDNLVNWTNGYAMGSSVIWVSSTNGMKVGQMVCLDQVNDGTNVDAGAITNVVDNIYGSGASSCDTCGRGVVHSATFQPLARSQEEYHFIQSISGMAVTLTQPLIAPNWGLLATNNPQVWWENGDRPLLYAGLENLTVSGKYHINSGLGSSPANIGIGTYPANVAFTCTRSCWVKNIQSVFGGSTGGSGNNGTHLFLGPGSVRCEVRHTSFIHNQSSISQSYGLVWQGATACWMDDNNFSDVCAGYIGGSLDTGNAISYSYLTNSPHYETGTPSQEPITTHSPHQIMLLVEGCYANGILNDRYHGSSGYTTAFRNRLTSWDSFTNWTGVVSNNSWCFYTTPEQRNNNAVGNIFGQTGWSLTYSNGCGNQIIYGMGCGVADYNTPDDSTNQSTWFIHANWDAVNGSVIYSNGYSTTLPASLVYASKPTNFGSAWPPYDPGNVLNATNSMAWTNIPAGYRFLTGTDPTPGH